MSITFSFFSKVSGVESTERPLNPDILVGVFYFDSFFLYLVL